MARLILQFEDQVLKECGVGLLATIGRLPDNSMVIDNPAVSSHHACVFRDGDHFVVEDLQSTNGTFVNDKRVNRHVLQNGDVVLVGKHRLVFDQTMGGEPDAHDESDPLLSNQGDTVFLDTNKHRALLAQLKMNGHGDLKAAGAGAGKAASSVLGVLRVVAGRADQAEYHLEARTSFIGKSDTALVRLQGWFKPSVAVAIARHDHGYVATVLHGKTLINSQPLSGRHPLKDGDVLRVSGLTLEFGLRDNSRSARDHV
jgi:pSer/pThr/pTyr-binding forkhead associated (FHA) protein